MRAADPIYVFGPSSHHWCGWLGNNLIDKEIQLGKYIVERGKWGEFSPALMIATFVCSGEYGDGGG